MEDRRGRQRWSSPALSHSKTCSVSQLAGPCYFWRCEVLKGFLLESRSRWKAVHARHAGSCSLMVVERMERLYKEVWCSLNSNKKRDIFSGLNFTKKSLLLLEFEPKNMFHFTLHACKQYNTVWGKKAEELQTADGCKHVLYMLI